MIAFSKILSFVVLFLDNSNYKIYYKDNDSGVILSILRKVIINCK